MVTKRVVTRYAGLRLRLELVAKTFLSAFKIPVGSVCARLKGHRIDDRIFTGAFDGIRNFPAEHSPDRFVELRFYDLPKGKTTGRCKHVNTPAESFAF
jgi:hypothetical protein